jgi:hypothetical protein
MERVDSESVEQFERKLKDPTCERLGVRFPRATHHVFGFQYRAEADRFLEEFRERQAKFGLELHPDKTRRIEFGRFAQQNRRRRGEGKPETFDFLGIHAHLREEPERELCHKAPHNR